MFKFLKKLFGEGRFENVLREKPRYHHYVFAHQCLPANVLAKPREVYQALISDDAKSFLSTLLSDIDEQAPDDEPPRDFSEDDIIIHPFILEERPCIIVQMPEPKMRPEAFFLAIVFSYDLDPSTLEEIVSDKSILFFTLEKKASAYSTSKVVGLIGSWEISGEYRTHRLYAAAIPPNLEEFKQWIAHTIRRA